MKTMRSPSILKAIIAMPGQAGHPPTPAPATDAAANPAAAQQANLTPRTVLEPPVDTDNHYPVGKLLRLPRRAAEGGGFRVWSVSAVLLGALGREDHYELEPIDRGLGTNVKGETQKSLVPCWILDTHPGLQAL